jgi:5-methylcytosine-specific restriction endonuclease McrA
LVRFDTQALQTPDISGIEYCHGTLLGYEVREYLLEKWGRRCAYCDAEGVPLQIEHIRSKARGGSDRISNWTLACQCCNQDKAARSIEEFLAKDPVRPARL